METNRNNWLVASDLTRREVLAATGGLGSIALAGCLHDDDDDNCDFSFEKSIAGTEPFYYGQQGTYIFEICNTGNEYCNNYPLEIVDELPQGITYVSHGSGWYSTTSGNTVSLTTNVGFASGFCASLEMTVAIGSEAEVGTDDITNCATLNHGESGVEESCVSDPVGHSGDCLLSLDKDVNEEFQFGQQGTYTLTVCNEGDAPCTAPLVLSDTLPTGISFDSASAGWTAGVSGNTVTLENDTHGGIAPGGCLSVDMTVSVGSENDVGANEVSNCAELSYGGDTVSSSCLTHPIVHPGECLLSLEKGVHDEFMGTYVDGEFQPGPQGTYIFTVCNVGDGDCTAPLTITDTLPAGLTFDSVSGAWTATVSGNAITLENDTYGPLAPGGCLTFEMVVDVDNDSLITSDEVTNCAVLSYDDKVDRSCVQHPISHGDEPDEPGECDIDYNFNSGYNNQAGTTLSDGDLDNIWHIVQDTTGSGTVPRTASVVDMSVVNARWGSQFTDTRWISHSSDAQVPSTGQTVTYQFCFCLHPDFHEPDLSLRIHAEDEVGDIRLNGTSLPFSGDGHYQGTPTDESYTDPQDFQVGGNCLEIDVVENTTGEAAGVNIQGSIQARDANCECGNH